MSNSPPLLRTLIAAKSMMYKIKVKGLFVCLAAVVFCFVYAYNVSNLSSWNNNNIVDTDNNASSAVMKTTREHLLTRCSIAKSNEDLIQIQTEQTTLFTVPIEPIPQVYHLPSAVKRCKNVFLDFGANIGDTFGLVVDTGSVPCDTTAVSDVAKQYSYFNVKTRQWDLKWDLDEVTTYIRSLMHAIQPDYGPEDYCYYGIEGNPHFTERLRKIEDTVMATHPRPIQHVHFFTDSVGTNVDGMTKLYLDTVNTEQNFWGSSIHKEHPDVRRSANHSDVETVATPVMGYTLGKLMSMTLKAFDPNKSSRMKAGGHLIIKIDIEGAEYPMLNQVIEAGTLCDYVRLGNKVDLLVEWHNIGLTDGATTITNIKAALRACGVVIGKLNAHDAE